MERTPSASCFSSTTRTRTASTRAPAARASSKSPRRTTTGTTTGRIAPMGHSIRKGTCGGSRSAYAIRRRAEAPVRCTAPSGHGGGPMNSTRAPDLSAAFAALSDTTRRAVIQALLAKPRRAGGAGGFVRVEPHVGGRLFESIDSEHGERIFEVGRVRVWDPPTRLAFSWRNANFAPEELTEVVVEFAPTSTGTLVTVTHRGWSALRADHPARHGLQNAAFSRMMGLWWGEQMTSLRQLCRQPGN